MKLSVLIPVYNERDTIEALLTAVSNVPVEKEIIAVDDCSTDGSSEILARWRDRVHLLRHAVNRGKGAAIRTALAAVTGDAIVIQDADLEYDPNDYVKLLAPIVNGRAAVVYGVRPLAKQQLHMRLGNNLITWATNLLYGTRLKDVETCYKVLAREVIDRLDLHSDRFEVETELTAQVVLLGYEICEVPISYYPRYGKDKKLTPLDGLPTLWALLKCRFTSLPAMNREPGRVAQ